MILFWVFFVAVAAFVVAKLADDGPRALPAPPERPQLPPPDSDVLTTRETFGYVGSFANPRTAVIDVTQASREARAKRMESALRLEREFEHSPHYESDEWIARYAEANRAMLLDDRDRILAAWRRINEDLLLVEVLKAKSPSTYRRMAWQVRALAKAEERIVPTPPSEGTPAAPEPPDPTAETRRAIDEQARREIALTAAIHEKRAEASKKYRDLGMPEDEVVRRVDELEEKLVVTARLRTAEAEQAGTIERY